MKELYLKNYLDTRVAMPRPKVLRRLVMDSVTLGVEKLTVHSCRVDKKLFAANAFFTAIG